MQCETMTPTTNEAKRIATLFRRKLTTNWSVKEVKAFKVLMKQGCFNDPDDLRLVETYYVFNMKKEGNYLRKDLYTFLNNFLGEVDRARTWSEHNQSKVRKANPRHEFGPATEKDFERVGEAARKMVEDLKKSLTPSIQVD
jgi:hypothetical protein